MHLTMCEYGKLVFASLRLGLSIWDMYIMLIQLNLGLNSECWSNVPTEPLELWKQEERIVDRVQFSS